MALSSGAKRFKEIQRSIPSITSRVLSKKLRELELNKFVERDIDDGMQLQITYLIDRQRKVTLVLVHVLTNKIKKSLFHRLL